MAFQLLRQSTLLGKMNLWYSCHHAFSAGVRFFYAPIWWLLTFSFPATDLWQYGILLVLFELIIREMMHKDGEDRWKSTLWRGQGRRLWSSQVTGHWLWITNSGSVMYRTDGARWTGRIWTRVFLIQMWISRSSGGGAMLCSSDVSPVTRHSNCIEVVVTSFWATVKSTSKGSSSRAQQVWRPVLSLSVGVFYRFNRSFYFKNSYFLNSLSFYDHQRKWNLYINIKTNLKCDKSTLEKETFKNCTKTLFYCYHTATYKVSWSESVCY